MRFSAPAAVFILGANEGVFPAYPASSGILSDKERRQLIAAGLPMTDASDWQAVEERFFAYTALSAPSDRLFISFLQGNASGESLTPSSLVELVERILPNRAGGQRPGCRGDGIRRRCLCLYGGAYPPPHARIGRHSPDF